LLLFASLLIQPLFQCCDVKGLCVEITLCLVTAKTPEFFRQRRVFDTFGMGYATEE